MSSSITALIIDDIALIRGASKSTLLAAGVGSSVEVDSGEAALQLLEDPAHGIDIAFCDLLMPGMDGVRLVGQLATLTAPPAVVFVSGVDDALLNTVRDLAVAQGLRVLGAVKKPMTLATVQQILIAFDETAAGSAAVVKRCGPFGETQFAVSTSAS